MILSAEKHGQDPDLSCLCADLKPVDRLIESKMPQAWQQIIVTSAAYRGHSQPLRVGDDRVNASRRIPGSLV
jgi:hypothetical protein